MVGGLVGHDLLVRQFEQTARLVLLGSAVLHVDCPAGRPVLAVVLAAARPRGHLVAVLAGAGHVRHFY